jgi:exodeoxyribonuclease VII small subunit
MVKKTESKPESKPESRPESAPESKPGEAPDFERALQELEAIVERMERGDIPLEESLRQFERGIALTRACQQALKSAEQKVQILIEENGKTDTRAFTDEAED